MTIDRCFTYAQRGATDAEPELEEGRRGRLLLVTAVRLRRGPRGLQLDNQTCAGLCRWAEHFEHVTFAGIVIPGETEDETSTTWYDVADLPVINRISFLPLPLAYRVRPFASQYRQTRASLAQAIRQSHHLSFTVGYLVGDWAAVAALEAIAQRRKFAIWFDRVEHDVLRNALPTLPFQRRVKETATLPLMMRYHEYLLSKSSLALLQGMDTFEAYANCSPNPACVYDVHTQPADFITQADLAEKLAGVHAGEKLRIVYVGRAAVMKGPLDWVRALAKAKSEGLAFEARWLGDGPMLEEAKQLARSLGLEAEVQFLGFVSDQDLILGSLHNAHILMFCHKTKESPRCLIEALVSGCPIVGYAGAYPAGLVAGEGGGLFSPLDDVGALAANLLQLDRDRPLLAKLIEQAARSGLRFEEAKLYRERAVLIANHA